MWIAAPLGLLVLSVGAFATSDPELLRTKAEHDTLRPSTTSSGSQIHLEWPFTTENPFDLAFDPLEELQNALDVMQKEYFEIWVGNWPTAIDWTAAVMGTHVSGAMSTFSKALESSSHAALGSEERTMLARSIENDMNAFFSQTVAYYFGENAFSIRNQAYDDMLWVVLGWLESIRFINAHSRVHSKTSTQAWYGTQFIDSFAHRAHVFYDIASRGWDTELCGGGMTWNPNLAPYKNAITNELFISASAAMYLYFPGDMNTSPFMLDGVGYDGLQPAKAHDPQFLSNAIDGYAWLKGSNMTNDLGLYVDGFHITGWGHNGSSGTKKCDARNEMLYTYNQAVLLSGLRGLWEATGNRMYLEDGHQLMRSVITATGWLLNSQETSSRDEWSGMGRNGILEELCDSTARCDQNGQTFKGIFFHHLTLFCEPLPSAPLVPGKTHYASKELALLHRQSCQEYALWTAHNAKAAMNTRDSKGIFGAWWTPESTQMYLLPEGAVDYRNDVSELNDEVWSTEGVETATGLRTRTYNYQKVLDVNDRGRGRTVETQGGGVAVMRALWELLHI